MKKLMVPGCYPGEPGFSNPNDHRDKSEKTVGLFWYVSGFISIQVLAYCHFFGLVLSYSFLLFFFLINIYNNPSSAHWRNTLFICFNFLATLLSATRLLNSFQGVMQSGFWIPPISSISKAIEGLISYYFFHYYRPDYRIINIICFSVFLLIISPFRKWIKDLSFRLNTLCLLAWLTLPFLSTVVLSKLALPLFVKRYLLISYFPFILLISLGVQSIIDPIAKTKKHTVCLIFISIVILSQFLVYKSKKKHIFYLQYAQSWRESTKQLSSHIKEKNVTLLSCQYDLVILDYYLNQYAPNSGSNIKKFNICSRDELQEKLHLLKNTRVILYKNHRSIHTDVIEFMKNHFKLNHYRSIRAAKFWVFD